MSRETFRITFQPEGQNVFVLQGTTLVEAAGQAGIIINTPCGGEGACGKCKIEVRGDAPPPSEADKRHFNDDDLGKGMRLACQLNVDRNLVVSIPEETRFFEQVVLTEGKEHAVGLHPKVRKCYLKLVPPSQDDLRSDVDRVKEAVSDTENVKLDIALIQTMPQTLRNEEFSVTAVLDGNEIVALEKGDTTNSLWGVAFDIGTTTIVGTLVDLQNGKRKAVAGRSNPQVHFGDDVVSRINYARENEDGLQTLHTRLVICLNEIIQELCSESGIPSTDIYEIAAVGNTTMTHILLEIDPRSIGQAPYVSVFREAVDVKARRLNIEVNRNANLHVLPNIAGFVGSDTVAMALASRINHSEETLLAIDIGTNGEIVIGNKDRCIACSTAAGPAFEGARIHFGMRATEGAISKVVANEEIEVSVVGGGRARGICGSGLLDAVAELLRVGVIDKSGRIQMAEKLPETVPEKIAGAITDFDGQPAFELVNAKDSKLDQAIVLTQKDVRELQLAKGAIWAGLQVLSAEMDVKPEEVDLVLLAGGFGNFMRRSNAKRVGLLPGMPTSQIEFIGNAAAVGARIALCSQGCREEATLISEQTEYLELANRPDFQMLFAEAMMFPEEKKDNSDQ